MGEVGLPAAGVDDHVQAVLDPADDQIVEHAAVLVGEHGIAQPAGAEAGDVAGTRRSNARAAPSPRTRT